METPAWLNENNTTLDRDETPPVPLHRESLFSDNTNRGILSAALATRRPGYQIDVFRLINHFVTGKIPRTLPCLMSNTLERGCQLLLHYSDDMVPYWEDLAALATQIKNVMGQDRVDLYEFKGLPDSANTWVPPKTFKHKRVVMLRMQNGTSKSPFCPRLSRRLFPFAAAALRPGHYVNPSQARIRLRTPTSNGSTAFRMPTRCIPSGARHDGYAASGLRLLRTTGLRFTLHGWQRWQPVSGVPVLVATDLGIDGGKGENNIEEEWLSFMRKCEAAEAPLLLLIPWQRQYWPENLGDYPFLIHWNRHTSAAMIRRLIGPGHGVMS